MHNIPYSKSASVTPCTAAPSRKKVLKSVRVEQRHIRYIVYCRLPCFFSYGMYAEYALVPETHRSFLTPSGYLNKTRY
jgi:hypothetical protein